MSVPLDPALRRDLARAALSLAVSTSWREVTLTKLADAANRSVSEYYGASVGEALDCVEEAFDRAIGDNLDKLDPMAIAQNLCCEVERIMGIFPNVPGLTPTPAAGRTET